MFFWEKPLGLRVFGNTPEKAAASVALAANQGLYNGFIAAGLVWSLAAQDPALALQLRLFFLGCVTLAGLYGGMTADRRIFLIQAAPALLALGATLAS